jgi:hypothetical protein
VRGPSVAYTNARLGRFARLDGHRLGAHSLHFQQQFPGTDTADALVTPDGTIPGVTYMPDATDGMDSIGI